MTPLVSIIIPVHNTEQYLRQCLNSIINQTFKNFEAIIINDCSSDSSYKIIEEFKQKDSRITVINSKKNFGLGFCRNEGLKTAKGKYIVFVDSDDWVKLDYIEILYNAIEKYNVDFVSAEYINYNNITSVYSPNEREISFYKQYNFYDFVIDREDIKKQILLDTPSIYLWSKIFKRDFLISNNIYFKIKFFEDNLFTWEAIANAKSFLFIKDLIYYYRINRKGSFAYVHKNKFVLYNSTLFENLRNSLTQNKIYEKYIKEYFTYISIRTFDFMEESTVSYSKLTVVFFRFREKFYTKDFVLTYKILNFKSAIKLFSFRICLKYNINYVLFVRIYRLYKKLKSTIANLIHFKIK
jgi:glycosyltransferase involved in cell wall biosynthesis